MRAGLLTRKIQVFRAKQVKGKTGATKETWTNIFGEGKNLNARTTYGKQEMKVQNGNFVLASDVTFDIRYYCQITEYDRIYWEDRKYSITAIRRFPERNEMQIDAKLIDE